VAVEAKLPTPKACDGIMGRPRTSGRPIEKSTHLGTIVTLLPTPRAAEGNMSMKAPAAIRHVQAGNGALTEVLGVLLPTPRASDSNGIGKHGSGGMDLRTAAVTSWGKYESAIRRWEALTRPAPPATEPNNNGNPRLSARFVQWMMGLPEGWVTGVRGVSRAAALKALGNGVVPQQAVAALESLIEVGPVFPASFEESA
jgi:DNA (cytosine-5)-methyltransferase 1